MSAGVKPSAMSAGVKPSAMSAGVKPSAMSTPLKIKDTSGNATSYWIEKHPDLPVVPFCLIATGRSRSGKTVAISNMLGPEMLNAKEVFGKNIFLFTGTKGLNMDYTDLVDERHIFDGFDKNRIEQIINKQERIIKELGKDYANQVLVILEDIADVAGFNSSRLLQRIAFRGRHALVSLIVSSQKLSSIPRGVRLNATYIIAFNPSGSEEQWYVDEMFPRRLRKRATEVFVGLWREPYAFLFIDNMTKEPARRFRKGFSEILDI